MSTELQTQNTEGLSSATIETVLIGGDLSKLSPATRVQYYNSVCESVGLNPLTKPFAYIQLNGRLTLYALKDATDQLRTARGVSIKIVSREIVDDVYVVTARATMGSREDESTGAVALGALKGEARANALMKAETKAKRRVTLSICGLGWLDESEADSVPGARAVVVDDRGEILGHDGGSKEAAQEVGVAKIKMLQAASGEPSPESEPEIDKKHHLGFDVLQGFAAIKRQIGSDVYYRILGSNGFSKSTEIPDKKLARAIYKEMAAELIAIRSVAEHGVTA